MDYFDEFKTVQQLTCVNDLPTKSDYYWVFDFELIDYTLVPLLMIQEVTGTVMLVNTLNKTITLPLNWSVLVFDEDSLQLDMVGISNLEVSSFTALVSGPSVEKDYFSARISLQQVTAETIVTPLPDKHQLLCHPVTDDLFICVGSTPNVPTFQKYLEPLTVKSTVCLSTL